MDTGTLQILPALGCKMQRIGNHSPGESLVVYRTAALLNILTHQRFATRYDHKHLMWIGFLGDAIEYTQKVVLGHILAFRLHLAVAATVAALQVATQRTLPEQLFQGMFLAYHFFLLSPEF